LPKSGTPGGPGIFLFFEEEKNEIKDKRERTRTTTIAPIPTIAIFF